MAGRRVSPEASRLDAFFFPRLASTTMCPCGQRSRRSGKGACGEVNTAGALTGIRQRNPRYTEAAYLFLLSALRRRLSSLALPRHISGAEVADAVRELALERFGPLARTVLEHWGVHDTTDIGEIVFALVECGVLIKQPDDSREDFEGLFTFDEAFEDSYPWSA
ncbi:Minf_1886 family protein [Candidatus Palauibacter sp.]|uniref:Minf_1886 family protein n=1 Tax=Candidatus Palauibacter sp. TaxID=3101350 RepID=UPI003C6F8C27